MCDLDAEGPSALGQAMLWLEARDLVSGTAGNASVRDGRGFRITPSAVPPSEIGAEKTVHVALDAGEATPGASSEWQLHRAVYRARGDVGAIVHTHSPYATALAMTAREVEPAHYVIAAFGGRVPLAPYARFGSEALAEATAAALGRFGACLMAHHGAISVGPTLRAAAEGALLLEELARVTLLARAAGGGPLLSDEDVADAVAAFAAYRNPPPAGSDRA